MVHTVRGAGATPANVWRRNLESLIMLHALQVWIGWMGILGVWLLMPITSQAQGQIKIQKVRVGFPSAIGPDDYYKPGTWVPVLVEIGTDPGPQNQFVPLTEDLRDAQLVVSTSDADGQRSVFNPLPVNITREELTPATPKKLFVTYIKVSNLFNEIQLELTGRYAGRSLRTEATFPETQTGANFQGIEPFYKLILGLGRPRGLEGREETETYRTSSELRGYYFSRQTELGKLPQFWFGYDGVDVIILPTGGTWSGSLTQALVNDPIRRQALEQWVARGGHLIVSVGSNANIVASRQSFPLEPLLPAKVVADGGLKAERLTGLRDYINKNVSPEDRFQKNSEIKTLITETVRLIPRDSGQAVISEPTLKVPVAVRAPYGLGMVTMLAFDVDQEPFASWENRMDFWAALLEFQMQDPNQMLQARFRQGRYYGDASSVSYSEKLAVDMETFGDVAVVSFFWVAVFIIIYVIMIGPIDYFFLKRVVKRLELTWITFPIMVILISVGAYFSAYYLKGDELRINKLDVIDVDQGHGLAVGTTFLSIFSPRLQYYDVAVAPTGVGQVRDGMVISWLGRPGEGFRGYERKQSDLFQRSYHYDQNGARLTELPIQVWAMKSLIANWQTDLEPNQRLMRNQLRESSQMLTGSITSLLPVKIKGAKLIHRDRVYTLGDLEPGQPLRIGSENVELTSSSNLLEAPMLLANNGQPLPDFSATLSRLMFFKHRRGRESQDSNVGLSYLDQAKRLYAPEAILVGTIDHQYGSAAEMNQNIQFGVKIKLDRPELRGVLRQTSYVRIALPIRGDDKPDS